MQINIFRIPMDQHQQLIAKLKDSKLVQTGQSAQEGWEGEFYFSTDPTPRKIPWVDKFAQFIGENNFANTSYFGAFVFVRRTTARPNVSR